MKTINEHIKKQEFVSFYLLYGEEDYLKRQMKERLVHALVADGDTMNYGSFEGKRVDQQEILDLAETLPFFAEKRVLVLEDTELGKKSDEDFIKRLEGLPDTTVMIFVEKTIDKRSKIYKFINKNGYAADMAVQDEKQLLVWVASLLKREGKQMTNANGAYFLHKVGTDMNQIRNELEKVVLYTGQRNEITKKDIDAICSTEITGKIFDMLEAIAGKQQKRALALYYELLELKEPPLKILALLVRQCNQMLIVKSMAKTQSQNKVIGKQAGIHPYVVGKLRKQAEYFTMEQLMDMVRCCGETDEGIKTGILNDRIGVELLIVRFSSK
ncbi:MAG: DNA polymerase III subunit delta [Anaerostipes sp.]|nr:DNA polymerase III subunit delta [Anaerostipes sp.]MDD5968985.1 DNA polymerase III subunit delta [Anaerostipes sp.]